MEIQGSESQRITGQLLFLSPRSKNVLKDGEAVEGFSAIIDLKFKGPTWYSMIPFLTPLRKCTTHVRWLPQPSPH